MLEQLWGLQCERAGDQGRDFEAVQNSELLVI